MHIRRYSQRYLRIDSEQTNESLSIMDGVAIPSFLNPNVYILNCVRFIIVTIS